MNCGKMLENDLEKSRIFDTIRGIIHCNFYGATLT